MFGECLVGWPLFSKHAEMASYERRHSQNMQRGHATRGTIFKTCSTQLSFAWVSSEVPLTGWPLVGCPLWMLLVLVVSYSWTSNELCLTTQKMETLKKPSKWQEVQNMMMTMMISMIKEGGGDGLMWKMGGICRNMRQLCQNLHQIECEKWLWWWESRHMSYGLRWW